MIRSSSGGSPGQMELGTGGASRVMAAHRLGSVGAVKAGHPVTSSYKTAPSDQTSVLVSTDFAEQICSGDMYCGEPKQLRDAVLYFDSFKSDLEMPKSITLIKSSSTESEHKNRFSGFRSR